MVTGDPQKNLLLANSRLAQLDKECKRAKKKYEFLRQQRIRARTESARALAAYTDYVCGPRP